MRLHLASPRQSLEKLKEQVEKNTRKILTSLVMLMNDKISRLREQKAKLEALNPSAILERGYSITRMIPQAVVVRDPAQVSMNQDLEVIVARGSLLCQVKGMAPDGKKDV